jgi:hypothetical protein
MYLKETNQESPAFLKDNRKCQANGRHNFKKRRWLKERRCKTALRKGEARPFIAFWKAGYLCGMSFAKRKQTQPFSEQAIL